MARDKTELTDKTQDWRTDDWGIPNWRDPNTYGNFTEWEFFRWQWEFSRRRDDLRACFDANAEASFERWNSYFHAKVGSIQRASWCVYAKQIGGVLAPPKPSDAGFVAFISSDEVKRFKYYRLPNPRISDQIKIVITPDEDDGTVKVAFGNDSASFKEKLSKVGKALTPLQLRLLGEDADSIPVPVEKSEVAVVFNLTKPLHAQLSVVKKNLLETQAREYGKPLQKRRHPEKWLSYLRTLDARADGASWAKIAALHPNTAQTEQTARDIWEAANALRFNF